jgi:5-oxoprolinase (ATP-hydrolysing) subunit A
MTIDLNADVGEGAGHDAALMRFITSANIACGGHAGDAATMAETAALARAHGVAIGAHPGFEDRPFFGRRELELAPEAITRLVQSQIEALAAIAPVTHVKPHGGLYNLAARNRSVADAIAAAVVAVNPRLALVGLAGSQILAAAEAWGLRGISEGFADRTYQPDGSLTSRTDPRALIEEPDQAAAQVLRLVRESRVVTIDGREIALRVQSICVHGDGARALELVRRLRVELADAGAAVAPF